MTKKIEVYLKTGICLTCPVEDSFLESSIEEVLKNIKNAKTITLKSKNSVYIVMVDSISLIEFVKEETKEGKEESE